MFVDGSFFQHDKKIVPINNTVGYLPIPKCASRVTAEKLFSSKESLDYYEENMPIDNIETVLMIVRNPRERFISGISQFVYRNLIQENDIRLSELESNRPFWLSIFWALEEHVTCQYKFYENGLSTNLNFSPYVIYIDNEYSQNHLKSEIERFANDYDLSLYPVKTNNIGEFKEIKNLLHKNLPDFDQIWSDSIVKDQEFIKHFECY